MRSLKYYEHRSRRPFNNAIQEIAKHALDDVSVLKNKAEKLTEENKRLKYEYSKLKLEFDRYRQFNTYAQRAREYNKK